MAIFHSSVKIAQIMSSRRDEMDIYFFFNYSLFQILTDLCRDKIFFYSGSIIYSIFSLFVADKQSIHIGNSLHPL